MKATVGTQIDTNQTLHNYLRSSSLLMKDDRILVAVSGGTDSMVLLHALVKLQHELGVKLAVAHCNFKLRAHESDRDEALVKATCEALQIQLYVQQFDSPKLAENFDGSTQMLARELRYNWFESLCINHGFNKIAIAHHLEDNIETFFINFFRGSGIRGLTGIPPQRKAIIRPMLNCPRAVIEDYARINQIQFVEDSSNAKDDYLRNRIRHHLLPVLNQLQPQFSSKAADTLQNLRAAHAFQEASLKLAFEKFARPIAEGGFVVSLAELQQQEHLKYVLFEYLHAFGFNAAQCDTILLVVQNFRVGGHSNQQSGQVWLSATHGIHKQGAELYVLPKTNHSTNAKSPQVPMLQINEVKAVDTCNLKAEPSKIWADAHTLQGPLDIRQWLPGDRFQPFGMSQFKKVSDFLTDIKVPKRSRAQVWVVTCGQDIVWVVGYRMDNRFRVHPQTSKVVELTIVEKL